MADLSLTIPENTEAKLFAYFNDDLKPITVADFTIKENVVLVGIDNENAITIYEINRFSMDK